MRLIFISLFFLINTFDLNSQEYNLSEIFRQKHALVKKEQYNEAEFFLERSYSDIAKNNISDTVANDLARIKLELGKLAFQKQNFDYAFETFNEAKALGKNIANKDSFWFQLHSTVGVLFSQQYLLEESLDQLSIAYNHIKDTLELSAELSEYYNNYGYVLDKYGKYDEAIKLYHKCLEIDSQMLGENHDYNAISNTNIGYCYQQLGSFELAEDYYLKSLGIRRKTYPATHEKISRCYNNLGTLYLQSLEFEKAEKFLRANLAIRQKKFEHEPNLLLATAHCNLGINLRLQNKLSKAIEHFEECIYVIEACLQLSKHHQLGIAYSQLSDVYLALNELRMAEKFQYKALSNFERLEGDHSLDIAKSYISLGNLYYAQNKFVSASNSFNDANKLDLKDAKTLEANMFNGKGLIQLKFENPDRALKNFIKGLNVYGITEKDLNNIDDLDPKMNIGLNYELIPLLLMNASKAYQINSQKSNSRTYKQLSIIYLEKSLEFAEQIINQIESTFDKSRLLEKYRLIIDAIVDIPVAPNENFNQKEIYKLVKQYKTLIADQIIEQYISHSKNDYRKLKATILYKQNKLKSLPIDDKGRLEILSEIVILDQKLDSVLNKHSTVQNRVVKDSLQLQSDSTKVFLEYFESDEKLHLFETYLGRLNHHEIKKDTLYEMIYEYINCIRTGSKIDEKFKTTGKYIASQILGNAILTNPEIDLLQINNDGILFQLPFEALILPEDDNRYLIEKFTVQYLGIREKKDLLSIENPSYLGIAPSYLNKMDLPNNTKEIEEISKNFNKSSLLLNQAATKNSFFEIYSNFDIIHFAAHATPSDTSSLESYIFLSDRVEDNQLSFSEISNLDLNNKFLILNACNTGTGAYKSGFGMFSLSKALELSQSAGALVSLYKLEDFSSRKLVSRFMELCQKKLPASSALRETKLEIIKNHNIIDELRHPKYWAGIILYGDLKISANHNLDFQIAFYILIIFIGTFYYMYKKSNWAKTRTT